MKLVALELNHQNFSLEAREHLPYDNSELIHTMHKLNKVAEEVVILCTCNRWAVYAYTNDLNQLISLLSTITRMPLQFISFPTSKEAVNHLFSTAAGIKSQIVGEHEIQGQIRKASTLARKAGTMGPILDECLRAAVRVGKHVRNVTSLGANNTSFASVSLNLIQKKSKYLLANNIMIVGTGNISKTVLKILKQKRTGNIYIASHSMMRAKELADEYLAIPILVDQIYEVIDQIDIIIGGAHHEVAMWDQALLGTNECPRNALKKLNNRPRVIIDLGMPRNFDSQIKNCSNQWLYDLDDLKKETLQAISTRKQCLPEAIKIVELETTAYLDQLHHRQMAPLYGSYWQQLNKAKIESLDWLKPKLENSDKNDWKLIEKCTHKLIRKISKEVFSNLRAIVEQENSNPELISFFNTVLVNNKISQLIDSTILNKNTLHNNCIKQTIVPEYTGKI